MSTSLVVTDRHRRLVRWMSRSFPSHLRGDLYAEGLLALVEASATWRSDAGTEFWTYARRSVFWAMTGLARKEKCIDPYTAIDRLAAPGPSPEVEAEHRQMFHTLEDASLGLTDEEREVVRLRLDEELDVRAVAARLGRSKSSVDRVYQRAVARLRDRMIAA